MLHYFPYEITLPTIPFPTSLDKHAEQALIAALEQQQLLECDLRLEQLAADFATFPDAVAFCAVGGSAHGYSSLYVFIQHSDGHFLVPSYSPSDQTISFTKVFLDLNLLREADSLRTEGIVFGGAINQNSDLLRGYPGRVATIYIVVPGDAIWFSIHTPLIGGQYPNTAANRLLRATLNLDITLI